MSESKGKKDMTDSSSDLSSGSDSDTKNKQEKMADGDSDINSESDTDSDADVSLLSENNSANGASSISSDRNILKKELKEQNDNYNLRVITFNLLTPTYATQNWFHYSRNKDLYFVNRLAKMAKLLRSWTKVNFIICFQEMSKEWYTILKEHLRHYKYDLIGETYQGDLFGIGIAYPMNHYSYHSKYDHTVGDSIRDVCSIAKEYKKGKENENIKIDGTIKDLVSLIRNGAHHTNKMLTVVLDAKYCGKSVGKKIMITTYHMPCQFDNTLLMFMHIYGLKNKIKSIHTDISKLLQKGEKLYNILAGDFNIVKNGELYNALTEQLTENDKNINKIIEDMKVINIEMPKLGLRSAHNVIHKKEPKYTNVLIQKEKKFVDCIDYILIGEDVDVRSCMVGLTVNHPENTSYPNSLCPSDHLPLSASLIMK